ncbi:unnamed protein product, partial [Urochloa humidicola]
GRRAFLHARRRGHGGRGRAPPHPVRVRALCGALLDPASRRAAALQLRRPLAPGDYSASPLSASALRRHFKSLAESLRVDASPAILDADGEEIEMGKPSL